jgi:hypothetical protein
MDELEDVKPSERRAVTILRRLVIQLWLAGILIAVFIIRIVNSQTGERVLSKVRAALG